MKYIATGNQAVSLPTIREEDAALEGISFLHMGAKGMIELCGSSETPLIRPFVERDGKKLLIGDLAWRRLHSWVPVFAAQAGGIAIEGTILAPIGERGFGWRLKAKNTGEAAQIRFGLEGCWAGTKHSVNESKPIETRENVYASGWNHCFVMDLRPDIPLFAFAATHMRRGRFNFWMSCGAPGYSAEVLRASWLSSSPDIF